MVRVPSVWREECFNGQLHSNILVFVDGQLLVQGIRQYFLFYIHWLYYILYECVIVIKASDSQTSDVFSTFANNLHILLHNSIINICVVNQKL